jgi:uncharacterized membrane protein YcaP (DUF421 family)
VNWGELFIPKAGLLEVFVRGTATYLLIFVFLRVLSKRALGTVGVSDLVVVILVAEGAQGAIGGDYESITEAGVLVATILGWSYAINWLSFHVPWLERLTAAREIVVVRDGRMNRRAMRSELLSETELRALLREQGIEDLAEVKQAAVEGDGELSVIRRDGGEPQDGRDKTKAVV